MKHAVVSFPKQCVLFNFVKIRENSFCPFGAQNPLLVKRNFTQISGLSAGTGKLCIFGHLGLVFIWSCFVSCLLLLLYYVICAPVLTEGTQISLNRTSNHNDLAAFEEHE